MSSHFSTFGSQQDGRDVVYQLSHWVTPAVLTVTALVVSLATFRVLSSRKNHTPASRASFPRGKLSDFTITARNGDVTKVSDLPDGWWTSETNFDDEKRSILVKVSCSRGAVRPTCSKSSFLSNRCPSPWRTRACSKPPGVIESSCIRQASLCSSSWARTAFCGAFTTCAGTVRTRSFRPSRWAARRSCHVDTTAGRTTSRVAWSRHPNSTG